MIKELLYMDKSRNVKEWLRRAKSSLAKAKLPITDDILFEDMCFDAQQSAEKSMKSLIIHLGLKPHKTHSARVLIDELKKRIPVPEAILYVIELDDYAVTTRYPDDYREVSEEEYKEAIEIAENVFNWVIENIK